MRTPFPAHARGFLYYHPPTSAYHNPRTNRYDHGHIRLRVTASRDPASFLSGTDLLIPSGLPWTNNSGLTWRVNRPHQTIEALADSLVAQGLVAFTDIARWGVTPLLSRASVNLVTPNQRFLVDFTILPRIGVAGKVLWEPTFLHSLDKVLWKSGLAVCHFEPCTRNTEGAVTSIKLMVDEILEPFSLRDPTISADVLMPTEGMPYIRPCAARVPKPYPLEAAARLTKDGSQAKDALWLLFNEHTPRASAA